MSVTTAQFHMLFPCLSLQHSFTCQPLWHSFTCYYHMSLTVTDICQFCMPVSVAQFHMLFPYVCHCSTVLHVSHCSAAQFHILQPHDTIDSFCSSFIVMYISTGFIQSLKVWKVGPFFHARESGIFVITVHR